MPNISGRRTLGIQSGQHSPNMLDEIVLVDGDLNEAGFLAWLTEIPLFPTTNKKFSFWIDTWLPLTDTVNGAVSGTTATSIKMDTILAFNAEQLWMNKRTREIYHIDSVNEGQSLILVARAVGRNSTDSTGTAAAAILDADVLIRIGPAQGEVSRRQNAQSTTPTEIYNYTEKKRWEITMSDIQRKTKHETGNDWPYQVDKTLRQARKDLNGWLYLGQRNTKTLGGQTKHLAGGLDFFISSNTHAASGTLHEYELDSWMVDEALRFGPTRKNMMASMNVIKAINQMTKDNAQYFISSDRAGGRMDIGLWVQTYTSPTGRKLDMMEDRFLTDALNGEARVIDPNVVRLRHFDGDGLSGEITLKENTQDVDSDDYSDTIQGDIGLEVGPEKHHGKLTGVTQGASGRSVG